MMTTSVDDGLSLLAELSDASARSHTEATLVPAVGGVLARHFAGCRFELRRDGGEHACEIRFDADRTLAVFRLCHGEETLGHGVLQIPGAAPALTEALLAAMGHVLGGALRQIQLLGRVAALARAAQIEKRLLHEELDRVASTGDLVAVGPAMRAIVHEMVPLVARQDTTVLLLGDTGTGKEIVARRIHALSPRAKRPFVAVNCGALPDGLVESVLFGHERGAFTGAASRHVGLFERAHGGTLLLDEVGELPKTAQAKLLRALQEGEIERVGGESAVRIDVRVIAATHRQLEVMVANGEFREDLFYRLDVFSITLPPLRDRPEDLEALTEAIVRKLSAKLGRRPARVSRETLALLRAHSFPGNVRELENVIERALILSPGEEVILTPPLTTRWVKKRDSVSTVTTYRDAVVACIERALDATGGKIYGTHGAANALGLKPTTLQSKIRKLGIRAR
jgi:transcriptional regulator with GAF, ATPase, and Fis domain